MRRAFTAIELAVVFVLIAVLAVMILPALESSRQKAVTTKCLTHVHQIGVALTMYQGDHDFTWPRAFLSVEPDHPHWSDPTASLALLYPQYAPKTYLFRCPATNDQVVFEPEGEDFLNCQNFFVSPDGEAMRPEDEGKGAPAPPSFFYDCGAESTPGIPPNASPARVVYGDECVHDYWESAAGEGFWVGENNHVGGGNFLFVDKHVEWLELQWTGTPWRKGESKPFVPNPHLFARSGMPSLDEEDALLDRNVFWDDTRGANRESDADLAGMMWFDGSWKEF